jgi:CRISPR/Cas system type I-B associated protein Csh2 (Cas7 group RAMP superfamily)
MAANAAVPIGMAKAVMVEVTASEPAMAKAATINGPISISVAIRIIPVGIVTVRIVAVVWVGRIEERISKVVKEEDPIVEAVMMELITMKTAEFTATKAAVVKAATTMKAAAVKASTSTETAVATATAVRHHV